MDIDTREYIIFPGTRQKCRLLGITILPRIVCKDPVAVEEEALVEGRKSVLPSYSTALSQTVVPDDLTMGSNAGVNGFRELGEEAAECSCNGWFAGAFDVDEPAVKAKLYSQMGEGGHVDRSGSDQFLILWNPLIPFRDKRSQYLNLPQRRRGDCMNKDRIEWELFEL